jgi:hypothetical protein
VDSTFHIPGEKVVVEVCACWVPENYTDLPLSVYIDGPDGRNQFFLDLTFNQLPVTIAWDIPENATTGQYTITVTWDHHYLQTGFIVEAQPIPEFPFPLLVFLVAFTVASAAVARRKASASPETPSAHS